MKYTFTNKHIKADALTVGIGYAKDEPFHWKPEWVAHLESLHTLKYEEGGYTSTAFFVPSTFQIFWFKFVFYIIIHKQKLSDGQRYINIESSYEYVTKKKKEDEQNFLNKPKNFFKD